MTTAKPLRPLRRAVGSVPIPPEQFDAWYKLASATEGLSEREIAILRILHDHFRQLHERGHGLQLSRDNIAHHLDIEPEQVRGAMHVLLEKGLIGFVKRGNGRSHLYSMTLPRRVAATLEAASINGVAGEDDIPPF
jgi:hypothetical protein